jgi:hypothetical protein
MLTATFGYFMTIYNTSTFQQKKFIQTIRDLIGQVPVFELLTLVLKYFIRLSLNNFNRIVTVQLAVFAREALPSQKLYKLTVAALLT